MGTQPSCYAVVQLHFLSGRQQQGGFVWVLGYNIRLLENHKVKTAWICQTPCLSVWNKTQQSAQCNRINKIHDFKDSKLEDFGKRGLFLILLPALKHSAHTGANILEQKCKDKGRCNSSPVIPWQTVFYSLFAVGDWCMCTMLGKHRLLISMHQQLCIFLVLISSLCISLLLTISGCSSIRFYVTLDSTFLLGFHLFQHSQCWSCYLQALLCS